MTSETELGGAYPLDGAAVACPAAPAIDICCECRHVGCVLQPVAASIGPDASAGTMTGTGSYFKAMSPRTVNLGYVLYSLSETRADPAEAFSRHQATASRGRALSTSCRQWTFHGKKSSTMQSTSVRASRTRAASSSAARASSSGPAPVSRTRACCSTSRSGRTRAALTHFATLMDRSPVSALRTVQR